MPRKKYQPISDISQEKWDRFLNLIANGVPRHKACKEIEILGKTLEVYLRVKPDAMSAYQEAKLVHKRREFPVEKVDQIMNKIALGTRVKAACDYHGVNMPDFLGLVRADPALKEMYDEARSIAVEILADECIMIADQSHADRDESGKPNHELINRDRLRVHARWQMAQALNPERYGTKIHKKTEKEVTVNHVEVLDGARKRKEASHNNAVAIRKRAEETEQRKKPNTVH